MQFLIADPLLFSLAVALPLFALLAALWLARRARRGADRPLAGDGISELLDDAVFVLDRENTLLDANASGRALLETLGSPVFGQTASRAFAKWPALVEQVVREGRVDRTLRREVDGQTRTYSLHLSALDARPDRHTRRVLVLRDLTEQHAMQEQLRLSEAHFQGILDAASSAIISVDEQQRVLIYNRRAEKMFGYAPAEVVGEPLEVLLPGRFMERQVADRLASRGELWEYTPHNRTPLMGRRKDGQEFPVEISLSRFQQNGRSILTAVVNDITQRRTTERALLESEAKFRTLAETTPAAIGVVDQDAQGRLHVLYINSAATTMTGYSPAELARMDLWDVVHPAFREGLVERALDSAGRAGGLARFEIKFVTRGGEVRWADVSTSRVNYNGDRATLITAFDVSERRWTEEALKLSEDRYRIFVENINDVIFATDTTGTVTYVSPVIERVVGFSAEEVVGQPLTQFAHPDDRAGLRTSLERTLAGSSEPYEFSLPTKHGPTLDARIYSRVVEADGQPLGVTGVLVDVTEHKRIETALRESRARYRTLFDSAADAIFVHDPAGNVLDVNRVACERLGYEQAELLKLTTADISSPEFATTLTDQLSALEPGDQTIVETAHVTREGDVIPIELNSRLIEYAGQPAVLSIARDITERKQMAAAEREQRILAEALRDTAAAITSTLDLDEVFDRILENVGRVVPHDTANIVLLEDDEPRVVRSRGKESERSPSVLEDRLLAEMARTGKPVWRRAAGGEGSAYFGAPIRMADATIGFINLYRNAEQKDAQADEHLSRLQTFANEAAIAIHNAQLYEQAQRTATLEERQRLARDLHDAVSQTLFSANVIAEMLPRLWERDPQIVYSRLGQLHMLTQGALAEMRTLLLELRPAALEDAQLSDLLRYLADALTGRKQIEVSLRMKGQPSLSADTKIALYRIAQEALNNVSKHSNATETSVTLTALPDGGAELVIRDNGRGIDPARVAPDRLGMSIMRERAEAIGANLTIDSQPGQGTAVRVLWPAA